MLIPINDSLETFLKSKGMPLSKISKILGKSENYLFGAFRRGTIDEEDLNKLSLMFDFNKDEYIKQKTSSGVTDNSDLKGELREIKADIKSLLEVMRNIYSEIEDSNAKLGTANGWHKLTNEKVTSIEKRSPYFVRGAGIGGK